MLSDCYLTLEICYYLCKKINMKGRHIKILTIFGLIAIIALQTIWLCNAYIQFSQSIYKDSNDILKKSLNREASIRFEKTPKGTMINGAPIKDSNEIVPEIAYLNEGLLKLGLELSLTNVDSLANDFLKATNIESTITIYLLNTDTEKVLNKSKNDLDIHSFGIIKTDIIPIRTDLSQGVQMILINPYYTIIKRMGLLLIATVILMIFVIGCIVYQIKIIARQNKIARLLQKELSDIFLLSNQVHARHTDFRQCRTHQPRHERGTRLSQYIPLGEKRRNSQEHQRKHEIHTL